MMFLYIFFEEGKGLPAVEAMSPGMKQFLIVLGAVLLVSSAVLLWAWLIRKRRRSGRKRRRHHRSIAETTAVGIKEVQQIINKRKRRRRRERRPRNPTLAETGGLPPVRPDEPPSSPEVETVT